MAIAKPTQLETAAKTINMGDYIGSKIETNETDSSYVTINILELIRKMKISKADLKDWMDHVLTREIEMNNSTMDGTVIHNNFEVQTKKKHGDSDEASKKSMKILRDIFASYEILENEDNENLDYTRYIPY